MKNLKKALSILLLSAMLLSSVLLFTACNEDPTEPTTTTPPAADPSNPDDPANPPANTNPTYTVKIIDEAGNPVSGVKVNFCNDSGCIPISTASDADGMIVATKKADAYKVQLRSVPAGYVKDETYRAFNENNYVEIVLVAAQ